MYAPGALYVVKPLSLRDALEQAVAGFVDHVPDVLGKDQSVLVPAVGLEPTTYGLQNRCTTTVLSRQINNL
jgi:hypothetical protein